MSCSLLIVTSVSLTTNWSTVNTAVSTFPDTWRCLILGRVIAPAASAPSRCDVFIRPDTLWGEILGEAATTIYDYKCGTYMLMLDDVAVTPTFKVEALKTFAATNNVAIASPLVLNATFEHMRTCHRWLNVVPFIEIYMTLFTAPAWDVFMDLVTSIPGVGWGYDKCLGRLFSVGINCDMSVLHTGHRSLTSLHRRATAEMNQIQSLCPAREDSRFTAWTDQRLLL